MSMLQFIDSMTGRLAWPLAAMVLGLIFRRSLSGLLERVRKLRYREAEAELEALAEAERGLQNAAAEAVKPLPDSSDGERLNRERVEHLLKESAEFGFAMSRATGAASMPNLTIIWHEDGEPGFSFAGPFDPSDVIRRLAS